jgi:putative cell wall-binding protein
VKPQAPGTSTEPSPGGGFTPSPSGWPNITADRIEGDDPAVVAATLSRRRFAAAFAPVVHITLGTRAHDAAAAGAAAVAVGGPVLVVTSDTVPSATATELARLASKRIVIVGGLDAISDKVVADLSAINGADVIRASGVDRFETAVSVSRISHSSGGTVFVVAGGSGIDGLGVTRFGRPILLTSSNHLPLITAIELYRLAPSRVVIVGGEASVTDRVRQQIVGVTGLAAANVERWSGPDRFATAAMAAGAERSSMSTAVLIQGHTLSGVAVATLLGDPRTGLFLARPGCVPASTRSALDRWRPTTVIAIGPSVDLTRTC